MLAAKVTVIGGAAAVLCTLAWSRSAVAQPTEDPPHVDQVSGELEHLVVISERERLPFHEPGAVTVLEAEQLARETPGVMPDLLRDQPGVFVQQTSPGQGAPIVRGLIGSAVLVLVDGVRLNSAFFRPAPNQFFALVDAYNLESVEIVRGAGASLLGSDAMGGAIRLFTPVPTMKGSEWGGRARGLTSVSSAARSWISRASLVAGKNGVGLAGGFTHQRHGDLRVGGGGGPQRPSGYTSYAADGKLMLERGAHQTTLAVQYLTQPSTPRFDELHAGFGRPEPGADLFQFEPMGRLLALGSYRLRTGASALSSLDLRFSYQRIQDDRRVRELGDPVVQRERNRSEVVGATAEAVAALNPAVSLTYGAEVYRDVTSSSRRDLDPLTGALVSAPARYPDGALMWSTGVFAQSTLRLHPRVLLTPGLRFSLFAIDIPAADRGLGADITLRDLSGGLGVLFQATPGLNLVLNGGRGLRAPNVFDLSSLGNRPGNRLQVPNLGLRPESILTVDGGLKLLYPRAAGELFAFYSWYRDKIEAVPTGATSDTGRTVVASGNVNRVVLMGLESNLSVSPFRSWQLAATTNYTRGRERLASGQRTPADRIPPLSGRVSASWRLHPDLLLEGIVRWAGAQRRLSERDRTDPRIDPRGTPAWSTLNLRLEAAVQSQVRLRLGVENLTNQRYREHGSGIDAAGFSVTAGLEAHL